jgi:membrane protease YdiL (CAAX protease family)
MSTSIRSWGEQKKFNIRWARLIILFLWAIYTALQILFLDQPIVDLIGFLSGIVAILVLLASGFSLADCYLKWSLISKKGLFLYIAIVILWLGIVLPTGGNPHWDWQSLFIFAPATSVAQEIFVRSALLPTLILACKGNFRHGLLLHSILFGIWHMGVFTTNAPIGAAFFVVLVPTLISLAWGWQVHRDGTVVWAILQHTILQIIMRLFTWG